MTSQHRGTQRKILRKRPKNINKAWRERVFWEKFQCLPRPTPSKTEGRVPRQQSAPTTCNLTYWEVSQQTHLQTLLATLGVVQGHNERRKRLLKNSRSSYCTHEIPSHTLNCIFHSNTFLQGTHDIFHIPQLAKICLKNRHREEHIHSVSCQYFLIPILQTSWN